MADTIPFFLVYQGVLEFALRFVLLRYFICICLNHQVLLEFTYILVLVQLIWDRALGLPLERPKSVTMEWLENYCKKAKAA